MLSKTFDILTPIRKQHRISRQIEDMAKFSVKPAKWVVLNNDGRVENVKSTTSSEAVELCIGHAVESTDPLSTYEANDTKVGRITTIAKPGTRIWVGNDALNRAQATTATPPAAITDPVPMVGKHVIIARDSGEIDFDKYGNGVDDFPSYKWEIGDFVAAEPALTGEIYVGIITDEDENGFEIRLIEPEIQA